MEIIKLRRCLFIEVLQGYLDQYSVTLKYIILSDKISYFVIKLSNEQLFEILSGA